MEWSKYQKIVQDKVRAGGCVLLIAPTGLGKTFAVTGDLAVTPSKVVYAVPLRALGSGVREAVSTLRPTDQHFRVAVHHGGLQESTLFSEDVVVTTYDQVVAGVPGLPLSLPLKAGHAVAGALLMSRLILDEAHLAWAISDQALTILFGILESRGRLGLQTVLLTATLPDAVVGRIRDRLGLEVVAVGYDDSTRDDEQLLLREANRHVAVSPLDLALKGKGESKQLDWSDLDGLLLDTLGKRIYFANTVERLQETHDRLIAAGLDADSVTVLHNRMPTSWRRAAESEVRTRFGKGSQPGTWILLTNQVAEAGLDISAPLVVSDAAPVDTLVQRAGRCARWFHDGVVEGRFIVLRPPNALIEDRSRGLASPYRPALVLAALEAWPSERLDWQAERTWVNSAWGGGAVKAAEVADAALEQTAFALNLFDRAAQDRRPGEIASAFREILSVEIGLTGGMGADDLRTLIGQGKRPDTSAVSLGQAWQLLRGAQTGTYTVRYDEGDVQVQAATYVQPGDILLVPPAVAYLHRKKGLCFGDGAAAPADPDRSLRSDWETKPESERTLPREGGRRQSLREHVKHVMDKTASRLSLDGAYRRALAKVLRNIEPGMETEALVDAIALIGTLAAGLHDVGKTDRKWQSRARELDPGCPPGLVGRTANTSVPIGISHTPPAYAAILSAARMLLGDFGSADYLIRSIALGAARHHSSFLNPARVRHYSFDPDPQALAFLREILEKVGAPSGVIDGAPAILDEARLPPSEDSVPLLLPSDDLFPIYALVGRAILMSDREDAAGQDLEAWQWRG